MMDVGEPIGRIASSPSFSKAFVLLDPDVQAVFGEMVLMEGPEKSVAILGRVIGGTEVNTNAEISELDTSSGGQKTAAKKDGSPTILRQVEVGIVEECTFSGNDLQFRTARSIPVAGGKVFRIKQDFMGKALGFKPESQLHIGFESMTGAEVRLPVEALARHINILGRPGTGKSYTTGVLIEECVKLQIPVVMVDVTGESKRSTEEMKGIVMNPGPEGFTVKISHLTGAEICELVPSLEKDEMYFVMDTVDNLLDKRGEKWTLHDLLNDMTKAGEAMNMAVLAHKAGKKLFHSLRNKRFIGNGMDWKELIDKHPVINLFVGKMPKKYASLSVATICRALMSMRERELCSPFVFILDEAHRFVPSGPPEPSSEIIANFLRVGRHLGMGTIMVSQSPSNIDKELMILSNTRIIHALDGSDLEAISSILGDAPQELRDRIPVMPSGMAVLCGSQEMIRHSCTMKVRTRTSTHGAKTPNLIEEADKWRTAYKQASGQSNQPV